MGMPSTVLVFSGGQPLTAVQIARLPVADVVIAADSGVDRAHESGCRVDIAVGDFDSVTDAGLAKVEAAGGRVVAHPEAKNETDLELALLEAASLDPDRIVVTAVEGGRPDHHLATLLLLADRRFRHTRVEALVGDTATFTVVHTRLEFDGVIDDLVSLLPIGGDAAGVETSGLRYPLRGETLAASSPRGMSNLLSSPHASVAVRDGTVMVITGLTE